MSFLLDGLYMYLEKKLNQFINAKTICEAIWAETRFLMRGCVFSIQTTFISLKNSRTMFSFCVERVTITGSEKMKTV